MSHDPALPQSLNPGDPVAAFLEATLSMTALVDEENKRLLAQRPASLTDLIEEKARRTAIYAQAAQSFRQTPGALSKAPAAVRTALKFALEQFDVVLLRNGQLILRLKNLQEGLLNAIAAEVNKTPPALKPYSAQGQVTSSINRTGPLAINARI
jgi:hypothetical protein